VRANAAAVIEEILVEAGDQVDDGATLLVLAEPSKEFARQKADAS
jgi:biotin carboxyl carrier protein